MLIPSQLPVTRFEIMTQERDFSRRFTHGTAMDLQDKTFVSMMGDEVNAHPQFDSHDTLGI